MSNQPPDDDLANVSSNLTTLANARARVRIDAAATASDTVGSALAAYRTRAGVTVEALADWLGLDLPSLADLAQELRPGIGGQEMGIDQFAELYGADRVRLLEVFDQGDE